MEPAGDETGVAHTHAGKKEGSGRSPLDTLKKWLGLGAAVLSLGSVVYARLEYVAESKEHARATAQLLGISRTQEAAKDYAEAWASLQKAAKGVGSEGLLVKLFGGSGSQQEQVRTAQQDLAMEWLRKLPDLIEEGHHFSEVTDQVLGVLSAGLGSATGERKADLLAHIGWAYVLKQDDGASDLHPGQFYKNALALDPANPYANTFLGYPIVEESSASDTGIVQSRQRFDAALASSRARGELRQWIREQEIGSLHRWLGYPAAEADFWQVVDQMHKAGEPLGTVALEDMRSEYIGTEVGVDAFTANLAKVQAFVPLADHVELLRMLVLTVDPGARGYLKVALAIALEKGGKPGESLTAWRDAKAALGGNDLAKQADGAIQRLSAAGTKHG
jgi:hypothetical protein